MSDVVDLEVEPRQPVTLTTSSVIPAPESGWSLELQRTATHLQVREVREEETKPWLDVVALTELAGPPGKVPVFAIVDGALAYRFGDSGPWGQLLTIESLKGDDGLSAYQLWKEAGNVGTVVEFLASLKGRDSTVPGPDGWSVEVQKTSTHIQTRRVRGAETTSWADLVALSDITGQPGQQGNQGASGMPNTDLVGTGMPNGVLTAAPGTTYKDTTVTGGLLGTNGASIWLKASGTGNTGWIVWRGNTGRRKLTLGAGLTGSVYIQRDADFVTVSMEGVANSVTGEITLLSAGLSAPWQSTTRRGAPVYRAGAIVGALDMNSNNVWKLTMATQSNFLYGEITFRARPGGNVTDSWPTGSLDGTSS